MVSADRIRFIDSVALEDHRSRHLSNMNTAENICDKRNTETLPKSKVSRSNSIKGSSKLNKAKEPKPIVSIDFIFSPLNFKISVLLI